jgi:hypothetical protein
MIELMTIGYENMPLEDFFRMLENRRVSMIVDLHGRGSNMKRSFRVRCPRLG